MDRESFLDTATTENADVVVIGAGITGACAAWDATARGLRTILIERNDFGGGTSAHSLKILHGGIRYLQHLDLRRLRDSCRERSAFLRTAPHLTQPIPFVVPTFGRGLQSKAAFRAALWILHFLTLDRNKEISDPTRRIPRGGVIGRDEALNRFPAIEQDRLTGAGIFYDGQIINPPRLVLAAVRSAVAGGAVALNYCSARDLEIEGGTVTAVGARDEMTGTDLRISTRSVINAAGPYAPEVFQSIDEDSGSGQPTYSRDMAFVVNRIFHDEAALALQTRYRDPDAFISRGNRHLFFVPWRGYTLIGVHSRVYKSSPNELEVTEEENASFLDEINEACPSLSLSRSDIEVVHAGLLPAEDQSQGEGTVSFGKRSLVTDHSELGGPEGLVSAIAVRWTMGRATAEDAVDRVERHLERPPNPSITQTAPVYGGHFETMKELREEISSDPVTSTLDPDVRDYLATNYGSDWRSVRTILAREPESADRVGDTPVVVAEILYAIRSESALKLVDVVLRRTDLGTGAYPGDAVVDDCAAIMAHELGWSGERISAEKRLLRAKYPFSNPGSGTEEQVIDA